MGLQADVFVAGVVKKLAQDDDDVVADEGAALFGCAFGEANGEAVDELVLRVPADDTDFPKRLHAVAGGDKPFVLRHVEQGRKGFCLLPLGSLLARLQRTWAAMARRRLSLSEEWRYSRAVRASSFTPNNVAQMPGYRPSRNVRRSVSARDGSDWKSGEVNGVFSKTAAGYYLFANGVVAELT